MLSSSLTTLPFLLLSPVILCRIDGACCDRVKFVTHSGLIGTTYTRLGELLTDYSLRFLETTGPKLKALRCPSFTHSSSTTMALIQGWYPPNKENYDLILYLWQWFPVVSSTFSRFTDCRLINPTVRLIAMDDFVVWNGQNVGLKPL